METAQSEAYKTRRLNILAAGAFIIVIVCLAVTVFLQVTDEFAKGIITLILGRFLGYVDAVYNFEFGTTRGAKAKDDAITNLAAANPSAVSVVREEAVRSAVSAAAQRNKTPSKAKRR